LFNSETTEVFTGKKVEIKILIVDYSSFALGLLPFV
jgi:hypothetical protein